MNLRISQVAMKFYGVTFIVLIFVLITYSLEGSFKITRSVEEPQEKFFSSRDKFQIQTSNCSGLKCSQFDSESTRISCYCKCSISKPSFLYEDGKWTCSTDKAQIAEGCGFSNTPIHYLQSTTLWDVPQPNVPCTVNETASRYQDCDGTWKPVGNNGRFPMREISSSRSKKTYQINIKAATTGIPDLKGRIIKLNITCKPTEGKPCYFFKMIGSVNCPFNPTERKVTTPTTKPLLQADISTSASTFTSLNSDGNSKNEFTATAIAGVVISGVLLICLALILGIYFRKKLAKTQAAEIPNGVILSNENLPTGVETRKETVTMETRRIQNQSYEEINPVASSAYTNLTSLNQRRYEISLERAFTESNESGTRNGMDYQDLLQFRRPSFESSYEPLQRTSKKNNGKEETLPHQAESTVNNDEDYEHMEIRVRNVQPQEKSQYENCNI